MSFALIDDYREFWPRGLVTYRDSQVELPESSLRFLREVGLPLGCQPWRFTGELVSAPCDQDERLFALGQRVLTPLLIGSPSGKIWLQVDDEGALLYCNASVEAFASCLTVQKLIARDATIAGLEPDQLESALHERFRAWDSTAVDTEGYWLQRITDLVMEQHDLLEP